MTRTEAVPDQILVRYVPGVDARERTAARAAAGVAALRDLLLPRLQLVHTAPGVAAGTALADLNRDPRVLYAEPNWRYELRATPNDPRFGEQWNLVQNTPGTPGAHISAPTAWDVATGSRSVKLAVLDTGIDYFHPDLAANMWRNPGEDVPGEEGNGIDDDHNGFVDDLYGWNLVDNSPSVSDDADPHGTSVAGVAGAVGNNGLGVAGVTWAAAMLDVKVCTSQAGGCVLSAIADGIVYAGLRGADVANMSFGGPGFSSAGRDALAATPNTLFVAAAPNSSDDIDANLDYPCSYHLPNVICVTGTDSQDRLVTAYGRTTVDLAAPAVNVLSTYPAYRTPFSDDFDGPQTKWDYNTVPIGEASKWTRTATFPAQKLGLEDSPMGAYANNADTRVTLSDPIVLTAQRGCFLTFEAKLDTESSKDYLRVSAATSHDGPYRELTRTSGTHPFLPIAASLAAYDGAASVYLRLELTSDGSNTADGAWVDNVEVRCDDPDGSYAYRTGTSLAAPQVAGAAALVKAQMPGLSVAALRERILRTVDPLASLAGKTVTGGRLNVGRALTADLDPPTTVIDTQPPGLSNTPTASFGFSASEAGAAFECRRDGGAFATCVSPQEYGALTDGQHSFDVRAIDTAGNVGEAAHVTWAIDTTAPTVTITNGPPNTTKSPSVTLAFSASEPGSSFECRRDEQAFAACASPKSYGGLADGAHHFEARARDQAGNVSTVVARDWTIDTSPPTATISDAPAALAASSSASFGFSASEARSSFECHLDDQSFGPCESPKQYSGLAGGEHTFEVRATDLAGNVGAPTRSTWTIDTTPPAITITDGPPSTTASRSATLAFSASETVVASECSLDDGAFDACRSPVSYADLAAGDHTFAVRAEDTAGNWSGSPATRRWTITSETSGARDDSGGAPSPPTVSGSTDTPQSGLIAPRPDDPEPRAWNAPEVAVTIPQQTLRHVARFGLTTRAFVQGECPCRLVQTLRLDGRTAKLMGLASLRGASASEVSIATKQMRLRRAGSARITLRIERRISKRLRGLRQAGGWLETSAKDQHHLTTIIRQQFKLRR